MITVKKLVVYYSFEGDTKLIGDAIAKTIDADILELKPQVEIKKDDYLKYYLGEKQVLMKTEPLLKPYDVKVDDYDLIVIGTPIWSGTFAPALRTFFSNEKIEGKYVGLFYCFTVKPGRISKHLRKKLKGNTIISEFGCVDPLKKDPDRIVTRAINWAKVLLDSIE